MYKKVSLEINKCSKKVLISAQHISYSAAYVCNLKKYNFCISLYFHSTFDNESFSWQLPAGQNSSRSGRQAESNGCTAVKDGEILNGKKLSKMRRFETFCIAVYKFCEDMSGMVSTS